MGGWKEDKKSGFGVQTNIDHKYVSGIFHKGYLLLHELLLEKDGSVWLYEAEKSPKELEDKVKIFDEFLTEVYGDNYKK